MKRRSLLVLFAIVVGCGIELEVGSGDAGSPDASDVGLTSSGGPSSSGASADGGGGSSDDSGNGPSSSSGGVTDAGDGGGTCTDVGPFQPFYCNREGIACDGVFEDVADNRTYIPEKNLGSGCSGGSTVRQGGLELTEALPSSFRFEAKLLARPPRGSVFGVMLGGSLPDLKAGFCEEIAPGDHAILFYCDTSSDVVSAQWKLQVVDKQSCSESNLPAAGKWESVALTLTLEVHDRRVTQVRLQGDAVDLGSTDLFDLGEDARLTLFAVGSSATDAHRSVRVDEIALTCTQP